MTLEAKLDISKKICCETASLQRHYICAASYRYVGCPHEYSYRDADLFYVLKNVSAKTSVVLFQLS